MGIMDRGSGRTLGAAFEFERTDGFASAVRRCQTVGVRLSLRLQNLSDGSSDLQHAQDYKITRLGKIICEAVRPLVRSDITPDLFEKDPEFSATTLESSADSRPSETVASSATTTMCCTIGDRNDYSIHDITPTT